MITQSNWEQIFIIPEGQLTFMATNHYRSAEAEQVQHTSMDKLLSAFLN